MREGVGVGGERGVDTWVPGGWGGLSKRVRVQGRGESCRVAGSLELAGVQAGQCNSCEQQSDSLEPISRL